jgi:methylmalonyl-CoA mutase cobalamin-binding subunit
VGISRALEMIVKTRKAAIESRLKDIEEKAEEIAELMLEKGVFDIRVRSGGITSVEEDGDDLVVYGFIRLTIPDADLRSSIREVLEGEQA